MFNLYRIMSDKKDRIRLPRNLNLVPIPIRKYKEKAVFSTKFRKNAKGDEYADFYGRFDLSEFLETKEEMKENNLLVSSGYRIVFVHAVTIECSCHYQGSND